MLSTVGGIYSRFNPRICKRCDSIRKSKDLLLVSFNPRICKRCDDDATTAKSVMPVSIHASVKDATRFRGSVN